MREYEGKQIPIIIYVPGNVVELDINVTLYEDGKTIKADNHMGLGDIRTAMIEGERYEEENAVYRLSDDI